MYERREQESRQKIRKYLQEEEVQERIRQDINRGRTEATVTISRAAELFDFSESRLRDWEEFGLLKPTRPTGPKGRRLYTPNELDKLAIIKELLSQWAAAEIPLDIDEIWQEVSSFSQKEASPTGKRKVHLSIDHRVENAYKQEFWRFFASQALRLSLSLIREVIPDTTVGIVLPLNRKGPADVLLKSEELSDLGECFIGWFYQNHTFHAFYDPAPSFEYHSDYRIRGLQAQGEKEPEDSTIIVVQRNAPPVSLPLSIVETIRRLLAPLYEDVSVWKPYFDMGMQDTIFPAPSFGNTNIPTFILTDFADMVVRLGGRAKDSVPRWRFCNILLPNNPLLPLQLRSLIVRAQSKDGPYTVNETIVSPDASIVGLSLRAFQSGRIIYRSQISIEDSTIIHREKEMPIRSAIAVPVGDEDGLSTAVIHVVSAEPDAFTVKYQSVLRMMGQMLGELLVTYRGQLKSADKLRDAVMRPGLVDKSLESFASENSFIKNVELLLRDIKMKREELNDGVISFISIDIDNPNNFANLYGDHVSKNLSKAFGERIKDLVRLIFDKQADCRIYYGYADRFYLILNGTPLEEARENAERLRQALQGNYDVSIMPTSIDQPRSRVELKNITVRLGVTSYTYTKLYEVLGRYSVETQIADVTANILYFLDFALDIGKREGGHVIISYYPPEPPEYNTGRLDLWPRKNEAG